jgi:DNA-binding transcriptional ArsR family regulator
MSLRRNGPAALEFPCECVSVHGGYSDPWAAVTQCKLLNDGTKERVLNAVARQPKTIAALAKELGLSQPTVHTHVSDMLNSELLREAVEWEKKHPSENYYEPNFPVMEAADTAAFARICENVATRVADVFAASNEEMEAAFATTSLARDHWTYRDVAQYCYATMQRRARALLEERGVLPKRKKRKNGAEWLFWAAESHPPRKANRQR